MGVALLFPGQGSQRAGMLARLGDQAAARKTFDEANDILGYDICRRDDETSLRSTVYVQLALLTSGVASARVLEAGGVRIDAVAGHSVGAFAAAVCARAMAFRDALRAVLERALAMEELFPSGYGMGAVLGLRESVVRDVVAHANEPSRPVYVANMNAPTQFVIAGMVAPLDEALSRAREAGAHRAERLNVAVPSHCPLLAPVQARLEKTLANVAFRAPQFTYVGSVGPRLVRDADALREDLAAGVAHEVRWYDATTMLVELGATLFIEMVPGRVLTDLAQVAFPHTRAVALDDVGVQSAAALARRA